MSNFVTTELKRWTTSCGLPAIIRRNNAIGILCGYVEVPVWHSMFEVLCKVGGDDVYPDVHGGITFFEHNNGRDVLTYGFDCGHYGDKLNILRGIPGFGDGVERDELFVFVECEILALQLSRLEFDL